MPHRRQDPVEPLADALDRAWAGRQPLAPLADSHPALDTALAYDVARERRRRRVATGARVVGRKIGFTNRGIWPLYGVYEPIWGAMYDDTLHALPLAQGTLSLQGLFEPRIEPEIVLHLASTPQPGDNAQRLLARVDQVAHGFEIVQSPYPGWRFGTADAVAAGSLHGALCLGPAVALADLGPQPMQALQNLELTLLQDGSPRAHGRGSAVLDGPLQALAHLVQALAGRPADEQLQAGEWVSTGTLTDAMPLRPGQTWHTTLTGVPLPGLTVRMTA
jgi:2-oxo-3-hexenedioate decarboxylase